MFLLQKILLSFGSFTFDKCFFFFEFTSLLFLLNINSGIALPSIFLSLIWDFKYVSFIFKYDAVRSIPLSFIYNDGEDGES
ncbi:hypothetical protein H8356DRAFT_1711271 [Neocallimastix lanati (nom. inval.)]|nr:hypothetical protein H8356DRAFT_1711271 [Neocallimastix sp. JGI-2020a]